MRKSPIANPVSIVATRSEVDALQASRTYLATEAKRLLSHPWHRRALEQAWLDAICVLRQAMDPSPEERALLIESGFSP